MRRAHSSRASGLRSNKLHLRELCIFLFLLVEKTLSRSSVTNSFLTKRKKSPQAAPSLPVGISKRGG